MVGTPIQLFHMNQWSLAQRYSEHCKLAGTQDIVVNVTGFSAERKAVEPLPSAMALLQDPSLPHQPLETQHPEDMSGRADTHRGPLAPQVFHALEASATSTAAAATSASSTTTPSAAASSSTSQAPSSPSSSSSSTVPSVSTSLTHSASTSQAPSASAAASALSTSTSSQAVPRSTFFFRRLHKQQDRRTWEQCALFFKKPRKATAHFLSLRCRQPKTQGIATAATEESTSVFGPRVALWRTGWQRRGAKTPKV
ncbi:uncharacterized protein ACBR49_016646 isoform 1-T3 [Aulostomus maculatus]